MEPFSSPSALAGILAAACLAGSMSSQAQAQAAPVRPDEPVQAGEQLAEQGNAQNDTSNGIVVTAQKREQRVQDVPIAINVISGNTLQAQGIREFADLTKAAPSLVIKPSENPVNASVSIRGIGTFAFSPGVEPSVAVQIDDVPVAFLARAFSDLSDIERIEVLRGPQSTLYGRSASAGLINIVTQAPTAKLTARVSALATTDDEYQWNLAGSGPINDTLGFRVSANWNKFEGNVRNLFNGEKVNGRETFSARGKMVWDPTSTLSLTAQVGYIDGETTIGRPFIRVSPAARLRGVAAYTPTVFAPGVTFSEDNRDVVNNITSGTDYSDFNQSLRASLELGLATLVSISAHDRYKEFDLLDQDESAIVALDNRQFGNFDSGQWSQEFRLVSPGADRFRYTLGLFYSDLDYSRDFTRGPIVALANWRSTNGITQYAAFGQLEFDLLPGTTLIGGARLGRQDIEVTYRDLLAKTSYAGDSSDTFETYKAGLQQRIAPDIMTFVIYATGYKGEAYDISTGFNASRLVPVRPETSRDWEVGIKSQFLDRALTFNVTLFDTRFKNFQAQGIETINGVPNYRLSNVGRIKTRGVEVEASVRVMDTLNLSGGATYNDAEITAFPLAQCFPGQTAAQGCTGSPARQDLSGYRPAQAPKWKLTAAGDFTPSLTPSLDGLVQAAATYQSRINYSLSQDPETVQPGFTIVNLSTGVRDAGRRWELVGFVNNLFDKQYFANLTNSFGNQGNAQAVQSYLPRDFRRYGGVRATYNF